MRNREKPPKLLHGGKKVLCILLGVLGYGALIVLGLRTYSNSTVFSVLLAVMVLLPPILSYGLMYGLSDRIDLFLEEMDKDEDDSSQE